MKETKRDREVEWEIRSRIYTKLRLRKILRRFEDGGAVWKTVSTITQFYIDHVRKLRIGTELISYSLAIYLANTNRLIPGILIGVIGVILADMLSKSEIKISAMKIANRELKEYDRKKQYTRDGRIF